MRVCSLFLGGGGGGGGEGGRVNDSFIRPIGKYGLDSGLDFVLTFIKLQ